LYNTTTALAAALAAKRLNLKAVCGSTTLEGNQIANCTYSASIGGADALTIGGVTAAMVTLTVNQEVAWRDKTIVVSVGAEVDGTTQYVPLGTFAVTDCKQAEGTTTITAYDAAYYALGGTYTPTVSSGTSMAAVLSDVADQCGLTLATLPAAASTTNVVGDLTGKTCRDMVGYLAALVGCNALIDRDGKLALRWFADSGQSYSPSDYYNAGLSIDGTSTLACIQAAVEQTAADADGNTSVTTNTYTAGGTGVGIAIQNPYMTQDILDTVWASIGGLEYTVGSCDVFHGMLTEPGDLVTITDKAGVAHTLAVMTLELSIDGGCRAKIQATAASATDTDANVSGSMTKQITKIAKDVMEFYTIVAQKAKVVDLEAANAEIGSLKTGKADVEDLTAATGRIDSLETDVANANKLIADKADVADLNATNAEVSSLKADKADVDLLNVVKATIENLLVRGGIITDSLSGVEINATKFLTGVTIIGDVIKAGTLQANRIILTGENGLIYELNVNAGNLTASQLTQEQYKQALDGSVLVASSITTDKLAAGSVTAQVIASGAITTDKLAANAVKAINIESGAITTDKLATGAITTDKLAAKAVKAEKIDVDNLFAQDITATGTITGAQLIGAILSGNAIDIQAVVDASTIGIKTEETSGNVSLVLSASGGTTKGEITLSRGVLKLFGQSLLELATNELYINADTITDANYSKVSYTSFSGGVISSGTINVVKFLGQCNVFGEIKLTGNISDWTEVLTSAQVPAPRHGTNKYVPSTTWGTSFVRAPRIQVNGSGGLRLRYGAAATYNFDTTYPI